MKPKRVAIIIPILVLITVSCTCGVPGLENLLASKTPTPTNTLPPTLTPIPSSTPTEEPTQPPTEVPAQENPASGMETGEQGPLAVIMDNSYRIDKWDYIIGLVQNNSDGPVEWIEMSVLLYDNNNQEIAREKIYPFLNVLLPGDYSPFSVSSDQWGNAASYDFIVDDWYEARDLPAEDVVFLNHTSFSNDYYFNIVGEVINNSTQPVGWVKIAGTLYDENDMILATNYTYSMLDYIAPGGKSPFKIWIGENWENGSYYEIQVQADYDEMPATKAQLVDYELTRDGKYCDITGTVKNISQEELSFISIIVSFYDSQNKLVDAEWSFNDASGSLPAGATDTFTVTSYSCPNFDHIEVTVE